LRYPDAFVAPGEQVTESKGHFKDQILDVLARRWNVAQFVSLAPDLRQRYSRIHGFPPNQVFKSTADGVRAILGASGEASVNIRSFQPENPKSREFLYGLRDVDIVLQHLRRLAGEGLYTIVNETIDVKDGGVSGVAFGGVVEFAPEDTPRSVEKSGTAALPRDIARRLFHVVYGFEPMLPSDGRLRVEFSIHPLRRGFRHDHTIVWEVERATAGPKTTSIVWPNLFSRFIGDKAYGLLIAHLAGLNVPRTTVIPRRTAPFTFGTATESAEPWIRTCPTEQVPGKFTTHRGWLDPYRLMQTEDPAGMAIASVLHQAGVSSRYSGALVTGPQGRITIEGVESFGDEFMVGRRGPERLPRMIRADVRRTYESARRKLGAVRFEWAHDGKRVWIVQLHVGATVSAGKTVYPGQAKRYHRFETERGINALRELIATINGAGDGIVLVGRIGITSHFGDVLRKARIPSRIEEPAS
jgi:hypothetical protein